MSHSKRAAFVLKCLTGVFLKFRCYLNLHGYFFIFTVWIINSSFKIRRATQGCKTSKNLRKYKENLCHPTENV